MSYVTKKRAIAQGEQIDFGFINSAKVFKPLWFMGEKNLDTFLSIKHGVYKELVYTL